MSRLAGDPFLVAPAVVAPDDTPPDVPPVVSPPRALAFTRKGYGQLLRADGSVVSQHVVAEEAYERAVREGAGVYRWVAAPIEIRVP